MAKKLIRITMKVPEGLDYVGDEFLRNFALKLDKNGLGGQGHLYSFFDAKSIEKLKRTGSYRRVSDNAIYAFNNEQLRVWDDGEANAVRVCFNQCESPALAVFDENQFEVPIDGASDYEYRFREPERRTDALEGIVLFK